MQQHVKKLITYITVDERIGEVRELDSYYKAFEDLLYKNKVAIEAKTYLERCCTYSLKEEMSLSEGIYILNELENKFTILEFDFSPANKRKKEPTCTFKLLVEN